VYNEEASLPELIRRCVAACEAIPGEYELLLVDDGSHDASRDIIESHAHAEAAFTTHGPTHGTVQGIFLNRNYGQHSAVMCGLAHAQGETIVTLDADLQNPPEEIGPLVAKKNEGYDVVGSVRANRQDSFTRRLASSMINRMVRKSTGVAMTDYGCMLRAYDRRIVDAMLQCPERSTFIPVLANSFARTTTEIEVQHAERSAGTSKYGPMALVNLAFDLITTMTTAPLRLMTVLGGLLSLAGIAFGLMLLTLRLVYGSSWAGDGTFTLFSVLFLFLGAQFVAIGLLGEYIGRIQVDVRARPRYFVDRIVGQREVEIPRASSIPTNSTSPPHPANLGSQHQSQ